MKKRYAKQGEKRFSLINRQRGNGCGIMTSVKEYRAVQKFPILDAYLTHFSRTSMKNEIPGLLSFFYIQGQLALPYVRIPTGDTHLDPRVHVFWIQPSRTGKSIAWNFVGDIMENVGIPIELFASGTDAGLIGSTQQILDEHGKPTDEVETVPGLLAGRKGINFDEGSILLTPNKHSQETVLYLQTACNPVGSGNNTLVKHMKGNKVECPSMVSLWITTYPPKGVKDYVLTKGIFQRVLLYWAHWDMDARQEVSTRRLGTFYKQSKTIDYTKDDLYDYFRTSEKRMRDRLLDMGEITFTQWDELSEDEKEDMVQEKMWSMFTPAPDFDTALYQASDEIYDLLRNMDASMSEIVASFTPAVENYLGIFATHMAILDEKWVITADHVDMAHEILIDLFQNLIAWLEDSVEINGSKAKEGKIHDDMLKAYKACAPYEIDDEGDGWRLQMSIWNMYMSNTGVSKSTAQRHFKDYSAKLFNRKKSSGRMYYRRKGEKNE